MDMQIRIQLDSQEPFADGMSFGNAGPYEQLTGWVHFAIDADDPAYQHVVDLRFAPRDTSGQVSYSTTFALLKPVYLARGNQCLFYDVVNRGNKRALQFFNDALHSNTPHSVAHAGNGFLMRCGYSILWSGWQGDLLAGDGRMTMQLPVATVSNNAITGPVRAEFIADEAGRVCFPLSGNSYTRSYATSSLQTHTATLTYRAYESDPRQAISPDAWQFAKLDDRGQIVPSTTDCYLPAGFQSGWIYELIYTAKDPAIMGLGFTGVRDLVSFLRHADRDTDGTPNPLRQEAIGIERAYAWGRSQSGRFLREFIYQGCNQDATGRRVFDGIMPHVTGAGRVTLNYRFAQPGRYPRQYEDHLYPSDQFPFAYAPSTDPFSCKTDAILKRPATDPAVLHTQTSSEYWQRRGSLVHTDAFGLDLPRHPQARLYLFASSQHFAEPQGTPQAGIHQHPSNPLDTAPLLRALLVALDQWVGQGTPPPDSCIPTRTDATLVPAVTVRHRFPRIDGVQCPATANELCLQDYGKEIVEGHFTQEPPHVDPSKAYVVLVPQIDADGNEIPGIRTPQITVPLATYTGWNPRAEGYGAPALNSIIGSYLPFAQTAAQRQADNDPRPALDERYRCLADYVTQIALAAQALVDSRLLLAEDSNRYVEGAMQTNALNRTTPSQNQL
jgi:hypothetical protein